MSILRTDTTSMASRSGNTPTFNHTVTAGSNLFLAVFIFCGQDAVTAVTYNGVSMTQLVKGGDTVGSDTIYVYGLLNPSTGTNSVEVDNTHGSVQAAAATYSGVKQSSLPDNTAPKTQTPNASVTANLTTIADNCMLIGMAAWSGATTSAGTGTAAISFNNVGGLGCAESSPLQEGAAGSYSLVLTSDGTPAWGFVIASVAPAVAVTTTKYPRLPMMGVGQ